MNSHCKEVRLKFSSIFKRFFATSLSVLILPLFAELNGDRGLPNVSARLDPNASQITFSADFLAWFASEEASAIWADVITVGSNTSAWNAKSFDFSWDYGLRLGASYGFNYDGWDTAIYWTWFQTDATHKIPSMADAAISPEFFAAFLNGTPPQSMKAHWRLLFNMFDLELGRAYFVSDHLSFRPFVGVKGGWISQSVFSHYNNLIISSVPSAESAREHVENNFWGAGPLGGVNTKWQVRQIGPHSLDLFGDFSMATLWGSWRCSDVYETSIDTTSSVNTKNSTLGALMFRGLMGLEWSVYFCKSESLFTARLGYEMQTWLNQLRIATFQLQRLHGDLTLQGVSFNCRFDF